MSDCVNRRQVTDDLTLHIYKKKCFYNNYWPTEAIQARGKIVDSQGRTITWPFDKVFNYMENGTRPFGRDDVVLAVRKVNGFLCNVSLYRGDLLFSTKGSIDNENVAWAKDILEPYRSAIHAYLSEWAGLGHPKTLMYEICDFDLDPHPVQEENGSYLIGIRNMVTGLLENPAALPTHLSDFTAESKLIRFGDVVKNRATCPYEGWMCYDPEDLDIVCKVKSTQYLIRKFFGRMSPAKVETMFTDNARFKRGCDEEFYPIAAAITGRFDHETWLGMSEQCRISFVAEALTQEG